MLNNQIQILLKKELLHREIEGLLLNLSRVFASHKRILQFPDSCTAFERDKAISSLRFLCRFHDFPPEVFFLSTTLFDSLLENNQVSSMMFEILHVACFCVSAISYSRLIQFEDVIKLTSCTSNVDLLYSTTNFILTKLQGSLEAFPTVLSLLKLFLTFLLSRSDDYSDALPRAIDKLEILNLYHKFNLFRVDELVLSLCHYEIRQMDCFGDEIINKGVGELIKHYQMDERRYNLCLREIESHLHSYNTQKSLNPRLKLSWTISKKLLAKMKPSTKFSSKLEPILESFAEEIVAGKVMLKFTGEDQAGEEIHKPGEHNITFQSSNTESVNHSATVRKLLLHGSIFTICVNCRPFVDKSKCLINGKFRPARLVFLPVSNSLINQFLDIQTAMISKKRKKSAIAKCLFLMVELERKCLIIPASSSGHPSKL